jgi:hypothetical protein
MPPPGQRRARRQLKRDRERQRAISAQQHRAKAPVCRQAAAVGGHQAQRDDEPEHTADDARKLAVGASEDRPMPPGDGPTDEPREWPQIGGGGSAQQGVFGDAHHHRVADLDAEGVVDFQMQRTPPEEPVEQRRSATAGSAAVAAGAPAHRLDDGDAVRGS